RRFRWPARRARRSRRPADRSTVLGARPPRCPPPGRSSQAPLAPAVLAAVEGPIAEEPPPKLLVAGAVPDLGQRLLERVAQDGRLAVLLDEGHEAARIDVAVRAHVSQVPRALAGLPGPPGSTAAPQARLGRGVAGGPARHAR